MMIYVYVSIYTVYSCKQRLDDLDVYLSPAPESHNLNIALEILWIGALVGEQTKSVEKAH